MPVRLSPTRADIAFVPRWGSRPMRTPTGPTCPADPRSRPLGMLEAFDAPVMEPNCEARSASTVAPQSLMLMNNTTVVEYAGHFAERLSRDAGNDAAAQVKRAWWLCFAREPGKTELDKGVAFLKGQTDFFQDQIAKAATKPKESAGQQALANFCHALLSANEFLYVD